MKVSLEWLSDFVKIDSYKPDFIESQLTSLGLECNIISDNFNFDSNVVIGKVVSVEKHPNADRLNICKVDVGENELLTIVCGAPNVKRNIFVPVAKVNALIGPDKFKIKKAKIRGVHSSGMICSGKELSINDDHDGIFILEDLCEVGMLMSDFLKKDIVLDIDLTPNRGDCFSHIGVAREIGTFTNSFIENKSFNYSKNKFKTEDLIDVDITDKKICKRYSCIIIKNINVEESPEWLKRRLISIGCKPINNIVDLANYIMYDLGQPLHAFDYDQIEGKKIFIRKASIKEKLNTINKDLVSLKDNDIVVADKNKSLALAGIIGSSNSHVTNKTKTILLESAVFNELYVRQSSKIHSISTESSKRFERNVDVNQTLIALEKFAYLLEANSSCKIAETYIDISPYNLKDKHISFDLLSCNDYLGTNLDNKQVEDIFKKLNFKPKRNKNKFKCLIPTFRSDLLNEIDLYEEVARVYGYDNIPTKTFFNVPYVSIMKDASFCEDLIRNSLSNNGFNEHYSNSLYSKKDTTFLNDTNAIKLKNPLSQDLKYLRNSLLPGLLKAVSYNLNRNIDYIKFYEIGSCQFFDNTKYNFSNEIRFLNVVWCGVNSKHWKYTNNIDVYTVKGDVDLLLKNIGLDKITYDFENNKIFINVNNINVGFIQTISKENLSLYDIDREVFLFSMNLDLLKNELSENKVFYNKSGQYPSILRDISFFVDNKYNHKELVEQIYSKGGKFLSNVKLFDYYISKDFDTNEKSLAYSLEFKSLEKTLTDKEVNKDINNIINNLVKSCNIKLRK